MADNDKDIRKLKHQATILSAMLHSIATTLTPEQKAKAATYFETVSEFAQSKLEASQADDEELSFFVDLKNGVLKTLE